MRRAWIAVVLMGCAWSGDGNAPTFAACDDSRLLDCLFDPKPSDCDCGDAGEPPPMFGEGCDAACDDGLECVDGICASLCSDVRDCATVSASAECIGGHCLEPCEDDTHCPSNLACVMGACRGKP